MKNKEISEILYAISDYLKMGSVAFKPYAYEKAAATLDALEDDIEDVYKQGGLKALEKLPGVGESIAKKIEEYLKSGKIKYYESFKKRIPIDMRELNLIEGLGPKKVKILYRELGITNIEDLKKAAKSHKIASLEGFGEKTEKNILQGIDFVGKSKGRFLLGEILPIAKEVEARLKNLNEVEEINIAGSIRRRKETIGDVDLLVISKNPKKVMDFFISLPNVIKIWGKGATKSSIRLKEGVDIDLRVLPRGTYGAGFQYFTGSKEHNIMTRKLALEKGLRLSEYGLFRGKNMIEGKTEEEIYKKLGMAWIAPELRENRGEIRAAVNQFQRKPHGLPELITYDDIRGDLHTHSNWDGGVNSLEEMAKAAMNMGYEYLGISDHTKFLKIEHGLDEKKLERRNKAIDNLNLKFKNQKLKFRLLKGCEANIMKDGSIDIKNEALKKLDYVIAGIHSNFKMGKDEMTERIIKAMENPNVDIISHPTGRILKKRDEYQIDFDRILKMAKDTGTILEINGWPERLDLNDQNIRRAKEVGVKMAVNTDSHNKNHLRFMELGISQARRGWAEKKDIINCWPLKKFLKFLK
jgi:DNA polymerase (family 10)